MQLIQLDNRGLQPPEPMVRILEILNTCSSDDVIEALMDRRPMFLFPELEERGLPFTCIPNDFGGFTLRIGDPHTVNSSENTTPASALEDDVRTVLSNVIDPELGIDIISLGLVYRIDIDGSRVGILMTLTVPGCPMSASIKSDVESTLRSLIWIKDVHVELTFDPPWTPERLNAQARVLLGR